MLTFPRDQRSSPTSRISSSFFFFFFLFPSSRVSLRFASFQRENNHGVGETVWLFERRLAAAIKIMLMRSLLEFFYRKRTCTIYPWTEDRSMVWNVVWITFSSFRYTRGLRGVAEEGNMTVVTRCDKYWDAQLLVDYNLILWSHILVLYQFFCCLFLVIKKIIYCNCQHLSHTSEEISCFFFLTRNCKIELVKFLNITNSLSLCIYLEIYIHFRYAVI